MSAPSAVEAGAAAHWALAGGSAEGVCAGLVDSGVPLVCDLTMPPEWARARDGDGKIILETVEFIGDPQRQLAWQEFRYSVMEIISRPFRFWS